MRLSSRIIYWILRRCFGKRSLGNQVPEYAIPTMMLTSAVVAGAIVLNPNIIQWMSQSTHGTINHDILSIQPLSTQIAPDSGLGVSAQTIARFSAPNTAYTSCFDANTCVQIPSISPTTAGSMGGQAVSQLQAMTQMLMNIRDLLATELASSNPLLVQLNQAISNSQSLGDLYNSRLNGYAEMRMALGDVGFSIAPWPGGASYTSRRTAEVLRNMEQIGQIGNLGRPIETALRTNGNTIQQLLLTPEYAPLLQSHPGIGNILASTINGAVASSAAITSYPGTQAGILSRFELMSQEAVATGQPVDAFRISPQDQLNQASITNFMAAQNIQSIANSVWRPATP